MKSFFWPQKIVAFLGRPLRSDCPFVVVVIVVAVKVINVVVIVDAVAVVVTNS